MEILSPAELDRVRPLLLPLDDQLAAAAILEGSAPGQVHVDDPAEPRAVFMWTGHRFYLAGDPTSAGFDAAVARLFDATIYPQAQAWGLSFFMLRCASAAWGPIVEETILRDRAPIQVEHLHYQLRYQAAINRGIAGSGIYFAAGRAAAGRGRDGFALDCLERAADLGFDALARLQSAPELKRLHVQARWEKLVQRLKEPQPAP